MYPKMDVVTGNRKENMYRTFRRFKVKDFYGFNFDEFIARPRYEVELILKECELSLKEENDALENIEKNK